MWGVSGKVECKYVSNDSADFKTVSKLPKYVRARAASKARSRNLEVTKGGVDHVKL
jgi:hypothetical protein